MNKLVVILTGVAIILGGCGEDPIREGKVIAKDYQKAVDHSGVRLTPQCGMGFDGKYTCGQPKLQYVHDFDDEDWMIRIELCASDENGKMECRRAWWEVDENEFNKLKVGDHYKR